jgi:predicted transcriptional regulator
MPGAAPSVEKLLRKQISRSAIWKLAALTPKRLHLLRYVRRHEVRNIKALAAGLRRNYKNVHKDVEELTKLGLLSWTSEQVVALYAEVDARFVL